MRRKTAKRTAAWGIGLILCLAATGHAGADNPPQRAPQPVSPGAEAAAIHQAVTAARLAAWGRKSADSQALILAARMLAEIPVRYAETDLGEPAEIEPPAGPQPEPFTVTGLLNEAEALSRGDGQTLADIEAVRAAATRGVADSPFGRGPILARRDIQARTTYWFEADVKGGEILRVAAIGDGDTDVDMIVRGADGAVLCEDGQYDHFPVCTLTPRGDARLRVEIINRGAVWTRVRILSN